MDHDELVRKYHTPRESLDPETRAWVERNDAIQQGRRERGEYMAASLQDRMIDDVPLPTPGSPNDRARRGLTEEDEDPNDGSDTPPG